MRKSRFFLALHGIMAILGENPPTPKAEFKTYSDAELKRLNAAITKMDEQVARAMVIHQMLGTRISDTLTLQTDCLFQKDGEDLKDDNGRIAERGSHEELLAAGGCYAGMWNAQAKYYA